MPTTELHMHDNDPQGISPDTLRHTLCIAACWRQHPESPQSADTLHACQSYIQQIALSARLNSSRLALFLQPVHDHLEMHEELECKEDDSGESCDCHREYLSDVQTTGVGYAKRWSHRRSGAGARCNPANDRRHHRGAIDGVKGEFAREDEGQSVPFLQPATGGESAP